MTKGSRSAQLQRLPFVVALIGLVPEAMVAIGQARYIQATVLCLAIGSNAFGIRLARHTPIWLEVGTMLVNALLAGMAGWNHFVNGSVAIHFVWWIAAAGFTLATFVVLTASKNPPSKLEDSEESSL